MADTTQREPTREELEAVGEEVRKLMRETCNAHFDVGNWRKDDDETFEELDAATDAAENALIIAIAKRVREAEAVRPSFDAWYAEPCTRCGGNRDWRMDGQYQAVCHNCGHPKKREPSELQKCIEAERREWERMASAHDLDRARAATDEDVRAVEALARAVLDMQTWEIVGSNFDPAVRVTDLETLNRLRHLASKIIPGAQATTGGASDE
jgi:hypothetical protein